MVALLALVACHRTPTKSEQLEALDIAYKSGVFTSEEYEAKRLALMGPPATEPPASAPADPRPQLAASTPAPSPASIVLPALAPPRPAPLPAKALPRPRPWRTTLVKTRKAHQSEDSRFFPASPERVRTAALAALDKLDFNIKSTGKDLIEATKKRHLSAASVGGGGEKGVNAAFRGRARSRPIRHARRWRDEEELRRPRRTEVADRGGAYRNRLSTSRPGLAPLATIAYTTDTREVSYEFRRHVRT